MPKSLLFGIMMVLTGLLLILDGAELISLTRPLMGGLILVITGAAIFITRIIKPVRVTI